MKKGLIFLVSAVLLTGAFAGCSSSKNTRGTDAEKAALKTIVESMEYTIDVKTAIPSSGSSINLNTRYSLTVDGKTVKSHLPYFGRGYSLPYGGGEGLIFDGEITDYKLTYGRKGEANISFNAKTREDIYKFQLEIYPGGNAGITVIPNNKQTIRFDGTLSTAKE